MHPSMRARVQACVRRTPSGIYRHLLYYLLLLTLCSCLCPFMLFVASIAHLPNSWMSEESSWLEAASPRHAAIIVQCNMNILPLPALVRSPPFVGKKRLLSIQWGNVIPPLLRDPTFGTTNTYYRARGRPLQIDLLNFWFHCSY